MVKTKEYKNLMEYKREHPNMSEGPADVAPIEEVDDGDGNGCAQRGSEGDRL